MQLLTEIVNTCPSFLGTAWINAHGLIQLLSHFAMNTLVAWIIVHIFYYPKGKRRDYYFTFLLISVCIFMLISLMGGSQMEMGAAMGLFAVFGILRYRTESVPIREMTYLFFIVCLSVVNAMSYSLSVAEIASANLIFILTVWVCESNFLARRVACKYVKYDNIDLIVPQRYDELVADLEKRLGVSIIRVEVGSVDFLKDMSMLKVFYKDSDTVNSVNKVTNFPDENGYS